MLLVCSHESHDHDHDLMSADRPCAVIGFVCIGSLGCSQGQCGRDCCVAGLSLKGYAIAIV